MTGDTDHWIAWVVEYQDAVHRKWTLFRGLWWTRRDAVAWSREWLRAAGNGGLTAIRVYKVTIPSGDHQSQVKP